MPRPLRGVIPRPEANVAARSVKCDGLGLATAAERTRTKRVNNSGAALDSDQPRSALLAAPARGAWPDTEAGRSGRWDRTPERQRHCPSRRPADVLAGHPVRGPHRQAAMGRRPRSPPKLATAIGTLARLDGRGLIKKSSRELFMEAIDRPARSVGRLGCPYLNGVIACRWHSQAGGAGRGRVRSAARCNFALWRASAVASGRWLLRLLRANQQARASAAARHATPRP